MDGALFSDADLGLSYPAPTGDAGGQGDLVVHPAPRAVPIDATPQPAAPAPIGPAMQGSADVVPQGFSPGVKTPAAPSAAPPAAEKLLSDEDLGIAPHQSGALSNAENGDTYTSGGLKGLGTTVIKGLSHIPGVFGDAMDMGDYLIARGLAKITGRPVEDILKENAEATKNAGYLDPRNFLPSGQQVAAPVLAKTGEYVPTTEPGKLLMAGGEVALGSLGAGGGVRALLGNTAAGAAAQGATDLTNDPLVGAVAGMATGAGAHAGAEAVKRVAAPAVMGVPGIDKVPVVGPKIAAARDSAAAAALLSKSSDPVAFREWAAQPAPAETVPGSPQTTAAAVGNDRGLFQAEKDARNANSLPFNAIDRAQSDAQQGAIRAVQPAGDVYRPGQVIRQRLDALDQAAQAAQDRLAAAHQEAVSNRAVADQQAQDSLVQAFRDAHDRATQTATDAAAPLANVPTAEQTGATLRVAQQEATTAAKQARDSLYAAVDPDGTLATVVAPLRAAKDAIKASIDPHAGVQPSGAEAKLWSDIDRLPDVVPFKSLQKLDSRVTAAMADARRNPSAEDPEALSRLTALKSATMDAIHDGVENQIAHEQKLVASGLLAPENTVDARVQSLVSGHFERQQQARLAVGLRRPDEAPAARAVPPSGLRGTGGGPDEGLGGRRGDEGSASPDGRGNGQPQVGAGLAYQAPALGDLSVSARMHAPETTAALGQDVPGTIVRPFAGPLDRSASPTQGIVAYHGTPHEFDRFSSEHIGKGEGAQVYSHGLYFAGNDAVGRAYRRDLSGPRQLYVDGVPASSAKLSPDERAAVEFAQEKGANLADPAHDQEIRQRAHGQPNVIAGLDSLSHRQLTMPEPGHFYQVRIARDPAHFLDWDKPAHAQSPYVTERLKKLGATDLIDNDPVTKTLESLSGDPRWKGQWDEDRVWKHLREVFPKVGDSVLQSIADRVQLALSRGVPVRMNSDRPLGTMLAEAKMLGPEGAKRLRDAGIAGVKYLDEGSRGAGMGTQNYVVLNDHDIMITHKNDVPLARPIALPDVLKGEARGAFVKELVDAGMSPASFSKDLKTRAEKLFAGGKTLDHGTAFVDAYANEAERDATYGRRTAGDRGEVSSAGGSGTGAPSGVLGGGLGRGGPGETGGAPRQDLTPNFDPAAAERLRAAKAAHAAYVQTFKNATVKGTLDTNGFAGQYKMPASAIPSKWVVPGDKGYEVAKSFLEASANDPRAISAMQDASLNLLRRHVPPVGTLHPNALSRWKEHFGGALRALDEVSPGFSGRFDSAANATQALLDMGIAHKQALAETQRQAAAESLAANAQSKAEMSAGIAQARGIARDARATPAGQFAGQGGDRIAPAEVENAVGNMLRTGTQGATRMRSLVSSVEHDPDALAGLRKAGVDWIVRSFQNADGALSGAKFISFVRDNKDVLKELYPTAQVSMFGAVAHDAEVNARWRTETAIKAGSDTAKNLKPMLEKAVDETKRHVSIANAATAGFLTGGPKGAAAGAGLYLLNTLRSNGIRGVDELYREALADPEKARLLISKMPETAEGGKLRALSGLLRRGLIVGTTQTQSAGETRH